MSTAFLGLGSNLKDRLDNLKQAVTLLSASYDIKLLRSSSIYETEPVGYKDQPAFLNQVLKIKTNLTPELLLNACLKVEEQLGRVRNPNLRYGPRILDIDILLFDSLKHQTSQLTLPHPRMHERAFVMVPLLEIDPGLEVLFADKKWVGELDQVGLYRETIVSA